MKTRARVAFVGVALLLIILWVYDVYQGFDRAALLHSAQVEAETWIEFVGGPFVIGGILLGWALIAPRHVVHQLGLLSTAATWIADVGLPAVSRKVKKREPVTVETAVPAGVKIAPDEFGDVLARILYLGRRGADGILEAGRVRQYSKAMKGLSGRIGSLTRELLDSLDQAERRTTDPDRLARLFEFDQQVVRLRRIAENLQILSGQPLTRRWDRPVLVYDTMRQAAGEAGTLSDQQRVEVVHVQGTPTTTAPAEVTTPGAVAVRKGPHVHGHVAAAVIHLLAELIDNAICYSPPNTKVMVVGEAVATGYAVTIEDRGLGLKPDQLDAINTRLAGPVVDILGADPRQLGLYTAARLAAPHHIKITLTPSNYGGIRAIVLLPDDLLTPAPSDTAQHAGGGPVHPSSHPPVPGIPASATRPRQSAEPEPAPRPLIRALPSATGRAPKPATDHKRTNPPAALPPQVPRGGRHEA